MPNYHIRIESDEDGVVGEWDTPKFLLATESPDDDKSLRWVHREMSYAEMIGACYIMMRSEEYDALDSIADLGPLLDG